LKRLPRIAIVLLLTFGLLNCLIAQKGSRITTVVIDAGHGGKDPGAIGKHAIEKDIALAVALKTGNYINEYLPDVKVIYTRKSDKFVELYKRAQIANEAEADLFISIHCNANNSPRPYGSETYAMGLHKTNANLNVAMKENAQVQPIKIKAENLLASIDTLVVAFQSIFNESARENLNESFNDIRQTFSNLQSTTSNIDTLVTTEASRVAAILENVDSLTLTLSENRHKFASIISNFEVVSGSLAKADIPGTFIRANKTLDDLDAILTTINSGEGSLGMLLHNDTLYIEVV